MRNGRKVLSRKIIIAAAGWILCCGASSPLPPSPSPQTSPVTAFQPLAGYSSDPCYAAKNPEIANVCAQWKAADAAKSSADAAWWSVYIGGMGIALAAITMVAAIAAALFAKKAAYENKRSADAAHGANRPWLDVDLKLHGVCVSYDRKGYSLQIELIPLNSGNSPAVNVREHVECLFYDSIPKKPDADIFDLSNRDEALQKCSDEISSKINVEGGAGPTVFPSREEPLYIETFVPWDFEKGYPKDIAWLIAYLSYQFPDGSGETVKVFSIRSFGFPHYGDFEDMGNDAGASLKIDPVTRVWPKYGYVK